MRSYMFFINFLILFTSINCQTNEFCITAVNEDGKCVPIKTCSIIIGLFENAPKPFSQKILDYLHKSYCGMNNNEYLVCCSARHIKPTTPVNNPNPTQITPSIIKPTTDSITVPEINDVSNHPNLKLLPLKNCGPFKDDRISNGNKTEPGQYPWMALLRYQTTKGLKFQCGGSLISSRYVLTAAHCVTGIQSKLVSVRLGEHDTSKSIDCTYFGPDETICMPPVQDINIEEFRTHPNYNNPKFSNDVAVIRLKNEANIQLENVRPICLPCTNEIQKKVLDRVIIAGWGFTEKDVISNKLLQAVVPTVPNDECQQIFKYAVRLQSSQMCAGGEDGVDSCKGDSGGPLFFSGILGQLRYIQYGIISAGNEFCGGSNNYPGIYTRVAFYMKWILDQLRP